MSRRSRRNRPTNRPAAGATAPETTRRSTSPSGTPRRGRRARAVRRYDDVPFYERFRAPLLIGFSLVGVALIGFLFVSQASGRSFVCETLLSPGPVETTPQPGASPAPGGTATPSAAPTATPSPSPTPSASPSPAASAGPSAAATPTPTPAGSPTPEMGFVTQDLGRQHHRKGESLRYAYCPPASGPHYQSSSDVPIPRAFYEGGVTDPGGWVHNLEHGWVVALYSCGEDGQSCPSDEEMAALRRFYDEVPQTEPAQRCGVPNKVLVARFDDMATRFAVVAWDRAMMFDTFDVDKAIRFAVQWMDGPAAPERGAC